ncbi:MAG: hypothetical protein H7841_13530 [Magnetospirillum sp. WYHS-4]
MIAWALLLAAGSVLAAEAPPPLAPPTEVGTPQVHLPPPETYGPGAPVAPLAAKPGDCRIGNTSLDGRETLVLVCMDETGHWRMRGEVR